MRQLQLCSHTRTQFIWATETRQVDGSTPVIFPPSWQHRATIFFWCFLVLTKLTKLPALRSQPSSWGINPAGLWSSRGFAAAVAMKWPQIKNGSESETTSHPKHDLLNQCLFIMFFYVLIILSPVFSSPWEFVDQDPLAATAAMEEAILTIAGSGMFCQMSEWLCHATCGCGWRFENGGSEDFWSFFLFWLKQKDTV